MSDSTEIVDYEKLMADMAKQATAHERPTSSTVKVRSGIIHYNGDPVKGNKLDVVVIASTHANLFYDKEWDPDDMSSPVCYAYSPDGENMRPHPKAEKPQHEDCDGCRHNKWGSDPKGGRGKACSNRRNLMMIPVPDTPEEIMKTEVAIMTLPVTSVKEWGNYVNLISATFGRPPLGMMTQIGVEPHVKHQFHVKFDAKGPIGVEYIRPTMDKVAASMELLEKVYEANAEKPAGDDSGEATGKKGKAKY